MELIRSISKMRDWSKSHRERGRKIAFVPTMGYFHDGHLALMKRASELGDKVVVSIFVNPTQFGPTEDFARYPRNLDRDIDLASSVGVDCIFYPEASEMYPEGFDTWVEVPGLAKGLCGASRPGHFRGVTTVVLKLFNIVAPHVAVFGQKDYQQLKIIQKMVRDLNIPVEIVPHPIVREPDGLAMSSRNTYLSAEERKSALCLYKALMRAKELYEGGVTSAKGLRQEVEEIIRSTPHTRIDYCFLGSGETLTEEEELGPGSVIALAVWVGKTRLIDNVLL